MEYNKTEPDLSIVIPVYNEGLTIEDNIAKIYQALKESGRSYEIIVVDDGSTDLTAERVKWANPEHTKVIGLRRNVGKGYALKTGFSHATGDIVVFMDADLDLDHRQIGAYIKALRGADIVVGSRFVKNADVRPYSISVFTRFWNKFMNLIFLFLTGTFISDIQSGIKFYRRTALEKLYAHSRGYELDVEMMAIAVQKGLVVHELPIKLSVRRRKISVLDVFRMLKRIIALRLRV